MYRESLQRSAWLKSPTTPAWAPCRNTQVSTAVTAARGKAQFSFEGIITDGLFSSVLQLLCSFRLLCVCLYVSSPPVTQHCKVVQPLSQLYQTLLFSCLSCTLSLLISHCKVFSIYSKCHECCSSNSEAVNVIKHFMTVTLRGKMMLTSHSEK